MTENPFQKQFLAGEVAKAAGIAPATLQNWVKRGVIIGHRTGMSEIEGGGSQGRHRRFSWHNIMEIATAAALIKVGVSDLTCAFSAAAVFAHSGHGDSSTGLRRDPGTPYDLEHGRTLMFVAGDRSKIIQYQPGQDCLATGRSLLGSPEGFVVIDLLDVFDRVCVSLGLHPNKVLDLAYSSGNAPDTGYSQ